MNDKDIFHTAKENEVLDYWMKHGHSKPDPGIVNLDEYHTVYYSAPEVNGRPGGGIYDIRMVKWLIENRGKDYFESDYFKQICK